MLWMPIEDIFFIPTFGNLGFLFLFWECKSVAQPMSRSSNGISSSLNNWTEGRVLGRVFNCHFLAYHSSTWCGQHQSCSGSGACASSREGVTVNIRARQTKIYEKKCAILFKLYLGHKREGEIQKEIHKGHSYGRALKTINM